MAVVSELIELGLKLKRQGKLKGAIEHFRQLRATYPQNARITFELAVCWSQLDVPEQALPLYRELLARPKAQSLPAKDLPRLYTRLGATHYALREYDEALSILEEGLRLHPSYRPLRAYRIFALQAADRPGSALHDALELMLESLSPSRWDTFEDQIRQIVAELRPESDDGALAADAALSNADNSQQPQSDAQPGDAVPQQNTATASAAEPEAGAPEADTEAETDVEAKTQHRPKKDSEKRIAVDWLDPIEDVELGLSVQAKKAKKRKLRIARSRRDQLGKKSVRIKISDGSAGSDAPSAGNDAASAAATGKLRIPIDDD